MKSKSPVSDEVYACLARLGQATVYELADATGRRPVRVWDALQILRRQGRAKRLTGGKRRFLGGAAGTAPQRWVPICPLPASRRR